MKTREITCIICPSSCRIIVTGDENGIQDIQGYSCNRGIDYGQSEFLAPSRTLTSTICAEGYVTPLISVRTDKPVPKEQMHSCMKEIHAAVATAPFTIGRVVIENICGTGSNVVLTNC